MKFQSAVNILAYAAVDGQIDEVIKLAIQTVLPYLERIFTATLQLNGEIWRDILGYEGLYQVSNFGRIKRCSRILSVGINGWGYETIALCKNGHQKSCTVHRLVAEAFLPNPDNLPQVDHLNGNKADNRVENLEWVTPKENIQRASRNGQLKCGVENCNAKLSKADIIYIRKNSDRLTKKQLAKMFKVDRKVIERILNKTSYKNIK